ncbi:Cyclin-dependent kinase B2-1 [Platanthera guangdongensis]|uniref:[RNA-polymerase]-subunit kinase n=1 Tax=Platanthera guangdongensis TaxID=2320717 RepID=A0ABR2LU93_9ASPA
MLLRWRLVKLLSRSTVETHRHFENNLCLTWLILKTEFICFRYFVMNPSAGKIHGQPQKPAFPSLQKPRASSGLPDPLFPVDNDGQRVFSDFNFPPLISTQDRHESGHKFAGKHVWIAVVSQVDGFLFQGGSGAGRMGGSWPPSSGTSDDRSTRSKCVDGGSGCAQTESASEVQGLTNAQLRLFSMDSKHCLRSAFSVVYFTFGGASTAYQISSYSLHASSLTLSIHVQLLWPHECSSSDLPQLGTPNEEMWSGVSKLANWHEYPLWTLKSLSLVVTNLETDDIHLLLKMLMYDPCKRISAKKAVARPYFNAELVTTQPLFAGYSELQHLLHIFRQLGTPNEEMWSGVSKLANWHEYPLWTLKSLSLVVTNLKTNDIHLLLKMLMYDPCKRISTKKAMAHPYFNGLTNAQLSLFSMDSKHCLRSAFSVVRSIKALFGAELVTTQPLFAGDSELQHLLHIFRQLGTPNEEMWSGVSKLANWHEYPLWTLKSLSLVVTNLETDDIHLILKMLMYDPCKRISAKKAMAHPYFNAELVTTQPLFAGDSELQHLLHIFRQLGTPNEEMWSGVSKLANWHEYPLWTLKSLSLVVTNLETDDIHLLLKMLMYDPCKRISANKAMAHPYFNGLTNAQLSLFSMDSKHCLRSAFSVVVIGDGTSSLKFWN